MTHLLSTGPNAYQNATGETASPTPSRTPPVVGAPTGNPTPVRRGEESSGRSKLPTFGAKGMFGFNVGAGLSVGRNSEVVANTAAAGGAALTMGGAAAAAAPQTVVVKAIGQPIDTVALANAPVVQAAPGTVSIDHQEFARVICPWQFAINDLKPAVFTASVDEHPKLVSSPNRNAITKLLVTPDADVYVPVEYIVPTSIKVTRVKNDSDFDWLLHCPNLPKTGVRTNVVSFNGQSGLCDIVPGTHSESLTIYELDQDAIATVHGISLFLIGKTQADVFEGAIPIDAAGAVTVKPYFKADGEDKYCVTEASDLGKSAFIYFHEFCMKNRSTRILNKGTPNEVIVPVFELDESNLKMIRTRVAADIDFLSKRTVDIAHLDFSLTPLVPNFPQGKETLSVKTMVESLFENYRVNKDANVEFVMKKMNNISVTLEMSYIVTSVHR